MKYLVLTQTQNLLIYLSTCLLLFAYLRVKAFYVSAYLRLLLSWCFKKIHVYIYQRAYVQLANYISLPNYLSLKDKEPGSSWAAMLQFKFYTIKNIKK